MKKITWQEDVSQQLRRGVGIWWVVFLYSMCIAGTYLYLTQSTYDSGTTTTEDFGPDHNSY